MNGGGLPQTSISAHPCGTQELVLTLPAGGFWRRNGSRGSVTQTNDQGNQYD